MPQFQEELKKQSAPAQTARWSPGPGHEFAPSRYEGEDAAVRGAFFSDPLDGEVEYFIVLTHQKYSHEQSETSP